MMSREELRVLVVASLHELHGKDDAAITDKTNPKDDLDLDSEDGVEFACEVSQRMGKQFPNDLNPFVDDHTSTIRDVGMIVDLLEAIQPQLRPLDTHDGE